MKTTLRRGLTAAGFDWAHGIILLQDRLHWDRDDYDAPEPKPLRVAHDDPRLDEEFSNDPGPVETPRFWANDREHVYSVGCYDGSSWVARAACSAKFYLTSGENLPVVGRG